jgi:hypothetical protein
VTWFKVDDQLWGHPKWLACSPPARALWITAGSWCAAQLTDGLVPRHVLPVLVGRPRDAAELVSNGLWLTVPEGWRFHDWSDFQPSKAQVEKERADARERMKNLRQGRKGSDDVRPNTEGTSDDVPDPRPDPSRPVPDPENLASSSHYDTSRGGSLADDVDLAEANLRVDELIAAGVEILNRPAYVAAVLRDIRQERVDSYCWRECKSGWIEGDGGWHACPDCLPGAAEAQGRN